MALFLSTVFSTIYDKDVNNRYILPDYTTSHPRTHFSAVTEVKLQGVYILTDAHDGDVLSLR